MRGGEEWVVRAGGVVAVIRLAGQVRDGGGPCVCGYDEGAVQVRGLAPEASVVEVAWVR